MALFEQKAPGIMTALMRDLAITDFQAAGILGNIGHECAGFTKLHQIGGSAIGWVQWDGSRKSAYSAWCARQKLDWQSDEANYGYLVLELKSSEAESLAALKKTNSLEQATIVFEQKFERAGVPALASRVSFADRAMAAYTAAAKQPATHDQPVFTPAEPKPPPKLPPRQPDDPGPPLPEAAPQGGFFNALANLIAAIVAAIFGKGH